MTRNTALVLTVLSVSGTVASAANFSWLGGSGFWSEHLKWFGPAGLFPNSITHNATVNGSAAEVTLNTNVTLASLTISNSANVYSSGQSIFVAGDVTIFGAGSSLSLTETPALRDMDCDNMTVSTGVYAMYAGVAQFDESLRVDQNGGILGVGTIEMNSTTGDIVVADGTIWAVANGFAADTLLIRRTASSTSRLDCSHPDSDLVVWPGVTMDVRIPFRGSVEGRIRVSESALLTSSNAVVGSAGSRVGLSGGAQVGSEAVLEAPGFDLAGSIQVGGRAIMDAPWTVLRGTARVEPSGRLRLDATSVTFDSFSVAGDGGSGGRIEFATDRQVTLNVIGGTSLISTGAGGVIDLDGRGDQTVNIASDSSLVIATERIDSGAEDFGGTMNIAGSLSLFSFGASGTDEWSSSGVISLNQGQVVGRRLINRGEISGRGLMSAPVVNAGLISAEGGALFFADLDLDDGSVGGPVIRAQQGEIAVTTPTTNIVETFAGSMVVGNGVGVRESFEMNSPLRIDAAFGRTGTLGLNSGLVRAKSVFIDAGFVSQGLSELRASGALLTDGIRFEDGANATIEGVLDLSGVTRFAAGASFSGSGVLRPVSVGHDARLANGADLGGLSLHTPGPIEVADNGAGQAGLHDLVMAPSAALRVDIGNPGNAIESDRLDATGTAELAGTLVIAPVFATTPGFGRTHTVLTATSVSGGFDTIDDSALGENYRTFVTVLPDRVEVFVTCFADLNASGSVDFFDMASFLALFNAQDPAADTNGDGQINFNDLTVFLAAFNSGC